MNSNNDENELRIAICDDEPMMRKKLHQIIAHIFEKDKIPYEVEEFDSGKNLLAHINNVQLVFLDIEMPELDGIQVGILLKRQNPDCQIIIASGREDRFKETYDLEALRFISKPYDEEEIWAAIQKYQNKYMIGMEKLEVFQNRNSIWIRQRDIQYLSAYRGGVEVMANGELYHKEISLRQAEELLDKTCFFQVHKAYTVNLFHVTDFTEKEITVGKIKIPLSKRKRKLFESTFMEFDIKHR